MEATTLLCNDHRKVEQLFRDYESGSTPESKKMCVDKMAMELSIHAAIEETKFYPYVKEHVMEATDLIGESLEEHQKVKDTLAELESMRPDEDEDEYDTKVQALILDVKHHVQEEEHQLFPKVRAACSVPDLQHLGQEMEEAKASAPTHPHPMAPNEGPAGQVAGKVAGAIDRARDMAHPNEVIREEVRGQRQEQRRES